MASNAEDSGEIEVWEEVGRELLTADLQNAAGELHNAFTQVSHAVSDGGELTERHVSRLDGQLEHAEYLVEMLARVVDDYDRNPPLRELLTQDEIQEAFNRADARE